MRLCGGCNLFSTLAIYAVIIHICHLGQVDAARRGGPYEEDGPMGALPGFKNWDEQPVMTAMDDTLRALYSVVQVTRNVLITYARRVVFVVTLPYYMLAILLPSNIPFYRTGSTSTAVAIINTDTEPRIWPMTWEVTRARPNILLICLAFAAAVKLTHRASQLQEVRQVLRERGQSIITTFAFIFAVDLMFNALEIAGAVYQLGIAVGLAAFYTAAWMSVPISLLLVGVIGLTGLRWAFRKQ